MRENDRKVDGNMTGDDVTHLMLGEENVECGFRQDVHAEVERAVNSSLSRFRNRSRLHGRVVGREEKLPQIFSGFKKNLDY